MSFMDTIADSVTRAQIVFVVDAIKTVWYVSIAYAGVCVSLLKRKPRCSEYGIQHGGLGRKIDDDATGGGGCGGSS